MGSGKSRVAAMLAALGAKVIDADAVGHALLDQNPVRDQVVARFGAGVLAPAADAESVRPIDRRVLGGIVFADQRELQALEAILHPRMRRTFERAIGRAERQGRYPAVVLDAAVLFEAGWESLCDQVIFVDASRERRLERLARDRGWTEPMLESRERAQWPEAEKRRRADVVLANNEDGIERLEADVKAQWDRLVGQGAHVPSSRRSPAGPRPRSRRTPPDRPGS
jgi:dephospho-CoA kinase